MVKIFRGVYHTRMMFFYERKYTCDAERREVTLIIMVSGY